MATIKLSAAVCCLLLISLSSRAESTNRHECIRRLAEYVAEAKIEPAVRTLMAESRHFYPDATKLIADQIPTENYVEAMKQIGAQYGCESIQQHMNKMADQVECYVELQLDMDYKATLEVVQASKEAGEAFEAYFACNTADGK